MVWTGSEQETVELYVAITSEDNNYRRYDYRPPKKKPVRKIIDPRLLSMREKLATEEGKPLSKVIVLKVALCSLMASRAACVTEAVVVCWACSTA